MRGFGMFKAGTAFLALSLLVGCEEDGRLLSRNARHYTPIPPQTLSLMSQKGTDKHAPILLRAYKQESELEIWKQTAGGDYVLLKTFPMCRWSGQLGPKKREGDRQVPEGFYTITQNSLNPNSAYYLSFNVGYPNAYDRAHGRTGGSIMVHGACSSMGCFSMTDQQIAEIYAITREAFAGGQTAIQLQSLPFRYTAENLAKYRADPNMPFWRMLKEGVDSFEVSKREPQVAICQKRYVFNRGSAADAAGACPPEDAASPVVQAVAAKAAADDRKVAELVSSGVGAVRRVYRDGDQHQSFRHTQYADASVDGSTVSVARPGASRVAEVSRPDALEAGPTEIPLDSKGRDIKVTTPPVKAVAAAPAQATPPAQAAAPRADAFAPAVSGLAPSGLFKGLLGGRSDSEAAPSVTAVEPDKPQPVRIPAPPRNPQRQVQTPAVAAPQPDKLVEAAPARRSLLDSFVALMPTRP